MTAKDGKPCKKCGTSEWSKWGSCKECKRINARKWREENPERKRQNDRQWQRANADRVNKKNRKWREENIEKSRKIVRESTRRWRKENPEKQYEASRRWKQANPERVAIIENNRRARKRAAEGDYTIDEWERLCAQYDYRCLGCGRNDVKLTADHVVPLTRGGKNTIDNIQPLCHSCNSRKRIKVIDYRTKPGILRWIQKKLF